MKTTYNFTVIDGKRHSNITKLLVFQGSFMDGETVYFQVSKYGGGWSFAG